MNIKIHTLVLLVLVCASTIKAQTFTYQYTDPCKGNTKSIDVPNTGVTVSYYGQLNTFQPIDFYNGNFEAWTNSVYSSFGGFNPCASIIGLPTAVDIAQGTIINFVNVLNSISAITDLAEASAGGSTNLLSGVNSIGSNSKSEDKKKSNSKNNSKNNDNTNQNANNNTDNTSNSNSNDPINTGTQSTQTGTTESTGGAGVQSDNGVSGNATTVIGNDATASGTDNSNSTINSGIQGGESNGQSGIGTNQSGDGSGEQTGSGEVTQNQNSQAAEGQGQEVGQVQNSQNQEVNSSESTSSESLVESANATNAQSGDGTPTPNESQTEEGGKTNILGGAVNTIGASSSPSNKNGGRPSILVSSDFVGFNFKNSDVALGGKVTGGYTSLSWDGKRSYGFLADYTTALRGPNVTGFFALMSKRRVDVFSGTISVGFDKRMTAYGTLSAGQMWILDKRKMIKAVYMITASYGNVYGAQFVGTAAIAGAVGDFKIGKRFDIKAMMLYVYAPYVSYYNDILLKSPHVVLPILGINVRLSKRFKLNINGSGAWAIKEATLNYSIMMGTRVLI